MDAPLFTFDDDAAEPVARRVSRALRRAVVTMRIAPGAMLSEQEVARGFGVSRQPVRESFIKLGEAGLVRVLPQRGTLVVKISRRAVEDARFIREALESAVAREAARRAGPREAAALNAQLRLQKRAARRADLAAFFDLDEDFHRLLAAIAGRPSAWRVVEDVKPQMDRVRYLSLPDATPPSVIVAQHEAIAEAVAARDPDSAEAAMRRHLAEILSSLPALAERHPGMFEEE